ncbi:MAG: RNB domain-containing ribonuclease [Betaproteobacteria bacterium]|nr:RNB domain-containing ribonuclease [Betaproteobacteria bacterium]
MTRNVFYEEEGDFKVGAILADNETSLQVEAPHGKRSKVKAGNVLFRFEDARLAEFMAGAQKLADGLDVDFLWQCCGETEFSYGTLAQEYFGRAPEPVESAALLLKLHGAPMYFYKKGRGRYKAAPPDALKAALASVERKRREAEQKAQYVAQLAQHKLPAEFAPRLAGLLYRPEKASIEWKALEEACTTLKLTPARLIERCGALPSTHDYQLNRFLFEHFPRGTGFPAVEPPAVPADLPRAEVEAFSIDDVTTTEIDDAFSVTNLPDGNLSIGIHIAAPALGIAPRSPIDAIARERLSTVYFPGSKITMLPEAAIERFTLAQDGSRPALSLYLEITPDCTIVSTATRVEAVPVAANLRHYELEEVLNEQTLAAARVEHRYGGRLTALWRLATALEAARRKDEALIEPRPEYSFYVENDRVRIVRRRRGTPVDRIVSELMVHVNRTWGAQLAQHAAAAIYRVQDGGKVRMSTVPAVHEGLGVESYAWASSPLRRYVDLVNQRQLIALARGEAPPYRANDETLLAAMRDFEAAHEAYGEFQRGMERYWCLRWLVQENVGTVAAIVIRESLARFDELPLVARVPSLPALDPGTRVELGVSGIDLLDLTLRCEYRRQLGPDAVAAGGAG